MSVIKRFPLKKCLDTTPIYYVILDLSFLNSSIPGRSHKPFLTFLLALRLPSRYRPFTTNTSSFVLPFLLQVSLFGPSSTVPVFLVLPSPLCTPTRRPFLFAPCVSLREEQRDDVSVSFSVRLTQTRSGQ